MRLTRSALNSCPFSPGGNSPNTYPHAAYTLGSLKVTQNRHRSPTALTTSRVKRSKSCGESASEKCSSLFKPPRMCEVMQADDGLDSALVQALQHLPIAPQCRRVEASFFRLNAAPFQREPQRLHSQIARNIKISLRILPPVARLAALVARPDPARQLPIRPLIAVVAFHLMGGRRHAPQKIIGKSQIGFGPSSKELPFAHILILRHREIMQALSRETRAAADFKRGSRTKEIFNDGRDT